MIRSVRTSWRPARLASVLLAISCQRHHPPPPLEIAAEAEVAQLRLSDCLARHRLGILNPFIGDPHGQGRDLLGFGFLDGGTFVRVDRFQVDRVASAAEVPIANVAIESRALTGVDSSTQQRLEVEHWKGAVIAGQLHCSNPRAKGKTLGIRARVREVVPNAVPLGPLERPLWIGYRLELELPGGHRFTEACRDPGDLAFPIPGYWNEGGEYIRDPTQFSFACTRRHVATCIREGYLDSSHDRVALLEACTRMMRADYCGDGGSHTRDGTFISLWDNRGIATEKHRQPMQFEAAWNRKGMVCSARLRWNEDEIEVPACLKTSPRPRCTSAHEAGALAPEEPLVFNDSCLEHPCVIEGQPEIIGGPARGTAAR